MNNFVDRILSEAPEGDRERFLALDYSSKSVKKGDGRNQGAIYRERAVRQLCGPRASYEVSSPDEFYE